MSVSFIEEVRGCERAVRTVAEIRVQHETWAAMCAVAELLGAGSTATLRKWVRWAGIDSDSRPGVSTEESAELKRLKRENAELKRETLVERSLALFLGASRRDGSG